MASSKRHWPSMFKSKPCSTHHQWQHDMNPNLISSTGCQKTPYSSVGGCEERSPEPKPRWNPKPEQIRILEEIFNSGMVNPPRDEIRKIRAQLQEFGQVGDANVFYWFQNRKSRSKHKLRHLQNSRTNSQTTSPELTPLSPNTATAAAATIPTATTRTMSSSDSKPSPSGPTNKALSPGCSNVTDVSNSPTASVNQTMPYFQTQTEFLPEPFFFPLQQATGLMTCNANFSQGFGFPSELSNLVHQVPELQQQHQPGPCTSLLLSEMMCHGAAKRDPDEKAMLKMQPQLTTYLPTMSSSSLSCQPVAHHANTATALPIPTVSQIQGFGVADAVGQGCGTRSTVFINDVAVEVPAGPFNVREAFGDGAVLIHSSGKPVITNEWGVTLHPLQDGAYYYLI